MKIRFEPAAITAILLLFCVIIFSGAKVPEEKQTAYVDSMEGLNIYLVTDPVKDHTFLGTVTMPKVVWNGKLSEMITNAVKRTKKQYPGATGVLIKDYSFKTVEAITIP